MNRHEFGQKTAVINDIFDLDTGIAFVFGDNLAEQSASLNRSDFLFGSFSDKYLIKRSTWVPLPEPERP